jgi:dipeptidyl-peptidase 4
MQKTHELLKSIPRLTAVIVIIAAGTALSVDKVTKADYKRANELRSKVQGLVINTHIRPHWLTDNQGFWYRNDLHEDRSEYILVDAKKGTRARAFDHEHLAQALAQTGGKPVDSEKLNVDHLEFDQHRTSVTFSFDKKRWTCRLNDYSLQEQKKDAQDLDSLEPLRDVRRSRGTGEETSITFINRLKESVHVYWLDADGRRQQYATLEQQQRHAQHTFAGHAWLITNKKNEDLAVFMATEEPADAVIDGKAPKPRQPPARRGRRPRQSHSPDGNWAALIKDHNVVLREVASGQETQLTCNGTGDNAYTERFTWSPDSLKLVILRPKKGDQREIHIVESSPEDQLQPKLHTHDYTKPGDAIDQAFPCLFDIAGKALIPISHEAFPNPWSIREIRWRADSGEFTFLYNQRGHQVLRIIAVNATTGNTRNIIDEQSETFIDYAGKQFGHTVEGTDEIIWMSERSGWNHLYLYDGHTGQVKNAITQGPWVVRKVERVDDATRTIEFTASGREPDRDPYLIHYYRIRFDGTGLICLTPGKGHHSVQYAPDRQYLIDTYSRVDHPPVHELRRASDGTLICELERADASALLETGWKTPEPFVAKGRDSETDIYGVIWRPTGFDKANTYPVIEKIYAGPHGSFVPKSWREYNSAQSLAELGFIVVQIDGMGTSHRSKAFHDICWKNLGDSGFPDRILWLQAAATKYPCLDLTRVGIYGGSAGGQSTLRALLAHGDFYQVGVADCGCHDNRMDKIWWNELWMGWPIGPHYEEQSNVTQAHKLQGKLLLTVGELDTNVDPASTMQVVNALVKADKDFDLLIVPGAGHGMGERPYPNRRRQDFFVRHLLGAEIPDWNRMELTK